MNAPRTTFDSRAYPASSPWSKIPSMRPSELASRSRWVLSAETIEGGWRGSAIWKWSRLAIRRSSSACASSITSARTVTATCGG